jgi:hypothetical protein
MSSHANRRGPLPELLNISRYEYVISGASKTAIDKTNLNVNAIHLFKAAGQDQKRLQTSTKLAGKAIPGHSSYQGSCGKFQDRN